MELVRMLEWNFHMQNFLLLTFEKEFLKCVEWLKSCKLHLFIESVNLSVTFLFFCKDFDALFSLLLWSMLNSRGGQEGHAY